VYEALLRWIKYDVERRSPRLIQLLGAVRCHFLSPVFLKEQLLTCELIRRTPNCCEFLTRIVNELLEHRRCNVRQRGGNPSIYILGGYLRHSLAAVDCWCPSSDRWYRLNSLPVPRSGVSACQVQLLMLFSISCAGKLSWLSELGERSSF
jgi:kelch-like protein 19